MLRARVLWLVLLAGCDSPREGVSREALVTLDPMYLGPTDGGKFGQDVAACGSALLAATVPGTMQVWFRPFTFQGGASATRSDIVCIGDRVFSVGSTGIESVTTSGLSYPSSTPGSVLSVVADKLLVANASKLFLVDPTTQMEMDIAMLPGVPTSVAGSPTHFYVGSAVTNELLIITRDGGASSVVLGSGQFGISMVTGDFSPNLGLEVAVARQGGVSTYGANGGLLWTNNHPQGALSVPSLGVARGWLPSNPPLDLLVVGYPLDEQVLLYLGSDVVEAYTARQNNGAFGTSVASSAGLLFVGAPEAASTGALYSTSLPAPPMVFTIAPNCTNVACATTSSCFGSVICIPRPLDGGAGDAGAVDGGAADAGATDAGRVDAGASDAGTVDAGAGDAGAADAGASDAGNVDAGAGDAGAADAGTVDAGAIDAGVDAGAVSRPDAGSKLDGGLDRDGGTDKDAGIADGGTLDLSGLSASGCTCGESTALLWVLAGALLTRRRRR